MARGLDRYCVKVTIDADNKVLRFSDDVGVVTVTLDEGDYWTYHTTGAELSGYPSLYKEVLAKLNAAATHTYTFELGSPAGDNRDCYHGLVLVQTSGSAEFGWYFSFASHTFPPELLGYPAGHSTDETSTTGRLISPRAMRHQWLPFESATSKISYQRQHIEESTEDVERDDAYQMRWSARRVRMVSYPRQPGVIVHKQRDQEHTDAIGLPTGETNVALEWIWEPLSRLEDVILIHDVGGNSDGWDYAVHADQFEVVRSYDRAQRESFEDVARLSVRYGERYDVSLTLVHRGGSYDL